MSPCDTRAEEYKRLGEVKAALDRFLVEHEVKLIGGYDGYEYSGACLVSCRDEQVNIEIDFD